MILAQVLKPFIALALARGVVAHNLRVSSEASRSLVGTECSCNPFPGENGLLEDVEGDSQLSWAIEHKKGGELTQCWFIHYSIIPPRCFHWHKVPNKPDGKINEIDCNPTFYNLTEEHACQQFGEDCVKDPFVCGCPIGDEDHDSDGSRVCDGDCDDHDDTVKAGSTRGTTCGIGECYGNTGIETCIDGEWQDECNPYYGAVTENCEWQGDTCDPYGGTAAEVCADGKDNDCDGFTDCTDCAVGDWASIPTSGDRTTSYGSFGTQRSVPSVLKLFKESVSGSYKKRHRFNFIPTSRVPMYGDLVDKFHFKDPIQSVVRIPGLIPGKENCLAFSRSARDAGKAGFYIVVFDKIISDGLPWKVACQRDSDVASQFFYYRLPGVTNHAGGMQALGTMLFIAADCDAEAWNTCSAIVQVVDVTAPSNPQFINTLDLGDYGLKSGGGNEPRAAAVAAAKVAYNNTDRYLIFVIGRHDDENGWFFLSSDDNMDASTTWDFLGNWDETMLVGNDVWYHWENVQFVVEQETGQIYMIATGTDHNKCFLYILLTDENCQLTFRYMTGKGLNTEEYHLDPFLPGAHGPNTRCGASVHVDHAGYMTMYVTGRWPPHPHCEFCPWFPSAVIQLDINEFRYHGITGCQD